ncbi:MAG: hypothetical protein D4R94_05450, partial [Chitinophagaceae bacterium]
SPMVKTKSKSLMIMAVIPFMALVEFLAVQMNAYTISHRFYWGEKAQSTNLCLLLNRFWTVDTMYYTKIYPITIPKFFFYQCLTIQCAMYQYGSALPSMTQESLNGVVFASPAFDEQRQIAQYLDTETQKIDTMITTVKQAITALITAAVTGKIDVRGFKLPKQTTLDDLAGCTRYHGTAKTLEDMDAAIEQGIIAKWGRHDSNL